VILGFLILFGGAFMAYQFLLKPLGERDEQMAVARDEIEKQQMQLLTIQRDKKKFDALKPFSLPADVSMARREYENELTKMLRDSGFDGITVVPKPVDTKTAPALPGAKKTPIYTPLQYSVQVRGDLASLVDWLERFYKLPLLHRIKTLNVVKPLTPARQGSQELDITATVEAIVLDQAENRKTLLPGKNVLTVRVQSPDAAKLAPVKAKLAKVGYEEAGNGGGFKVPEAAFKEALPSFAKALPSELKPGVAVPVSEDGVTVTVKPDVAVEPPHLLNPDRQYASIAGKNIFYGPVQEVVRDKPKVDFAEFIKCDSIVYENGAPVASLWDAYRNEDYRISTRDGGYRVEVKWYVGDKKRTLRNSTNEIVVEDENGAPQHRWHIVRLDDREVILRDKDGKLHALHVGETLAETELLSAEDIKDLGLVEETAKPEKEVKVSEKKPPGER
jgi:hypothetical protein